MNNSFNLYWASFFRNSEPALHYLSQQTGDEKDPLVSRALATKASSLAPHLVVFIEHLEVTQHQVSLLMLIERLLCARHYSKSFMDVNSFDLQMILWDKHYYLPHIPDEGSETESSGHLPKVTSCSVGSWNWRRFYNSCSQPLINGFWAFHEMFHVCP